MPEKIQININKQFIIVSSLLLAINFILELYYVFFLSIDFNYLGFKAEFSLIKYIEIKLFLILFIVLSYYLFKKSPFIYSIYILLLGLISFIQHTL